MGILLGLTAALSWGLADYFAAIASRRTGSLRVVLGFHLAATGLLAVLVFASGGGVAAVSGSDLGWFVFVGALGWLSYLAFYRALAIGPISIVSPIVSAYAASTVVCAVLIGGERSGAARRSRSWSSSSASSSRRPTWRRCGRSSPSPRLGSSLRS